MRGMYVADNGSMSLREGKIICSWNGNYALFTAAEIQHIELRQLSEEKDGCLSVELTNRTMIHLHFDDSQKDEMMELYRILIKGGTNETEKKRYRNGLVILSFIAVGLLLYMIAG